MSKTRNTMALGVVVLSVFVLSGFAESIGDEPSTKTVLYRGRDIQLRYPENWSAVDNGDFIYIAPSDGFLDGSLVYGMMIATFDPQTGASAGTPESEITLEDATAQVVAQFRQWNQNVGMVLDRGKTRIAGIDATVVDITNESPTGVMQTDLLITLVRSDGLVTYFLGIAPQIEFSRFRPAFDRILASVRFLQ
jgi:hypothetical protein